MAQGYYNVTFTGPAVYTLRRAVDKQGRDKPGSYLLQESISYETRDDRRWTVRATPEAPFETDLASIPTLASWLVPKDGSHTPAALIHDAMVLGKKELPAYEPCDPLVSREDADTIFRQGMQFLGVRFVRRWMMWAAVSIPTFSKLAWWRALLVGVGLAVFGYLGLFGVPDVFDVPGEITVPCTDWHLTWSAHWIDEGSLRGELGRFLLLAVVGSVIYAVLWARKRWRFGMTIGLALSFLTFPLAITAVAFVLLAAVEAVIATGLLIAKRRGRDRGRVRAPAVVEDLAARF
jgi:Protein of unknown function (DUF1353)